MKCGIKPAVFVLVFKFVASLVILRAVVCSVYESNGIIMSAHVCHQWEGVERWLLPLCHSNNNKKEECQPAGINKSFVCCCILKPV